jgi:O-antigen/teichoic acid export membrane protein
MTYNKGRTSILKGAALAITMRWSDRMIGLASTLILARLLVPEDFGIIAMASLVVGLLDVLLDLGVNVALIQNRNAEPAHYDTAWTLRLLQTVVSATLIASGAPLAGDYFGDQRVVAVLQAMSIGLVLMGLENIGVITFQKNMQFGLDFRFIFTKRIAGFLATIAAAWFLRSYWALVIGTLVSKTTGVLLSYAMHPMRPRISFEKFREIFGVSQWMLIRSIGGYLDNNLTKT